MIHISKLNSNHTESCSKLNILNSNLAILHHFSSLNIVFDVRWHKEINCILQPVAFHMKVVSISVNSWNLVKDIAE